MGETSWTYVAICIGLPLAWGLLAEWVFGKAQRYLVKRRKSPLEPQPGSAGRFDTTPPTLDYRI